MEMAYDLAWWQSWLQIAINALCIGGGLGLLSALFYWLRGRPYRPNRHPRQVALLSLIALMLGVLAFFLTRGLLAPQQIPI